MNLIESFSICTFDHRTRCRSTPTNTNKERLTMRCPVCEDQLRPLERNGVEIEMCPTCKGVWLDRGELDTLLAGSGGGERCPASRQTSRQAQVRRPARRPARHDRRGRGRLNGRGAVTTMARTPTLDLTTTADIEVLTPTDPPGRRAARAGSCPRANRDSAAAGAAPRPDRRRGGRASRRRRPERAPLDAVAHAPATAGGRRPRADAAPAARVRDDLPPPGGPAGSPAAAHLRLRRRRHHLRAGAPHRARAECAPRPLEPACSGHPRGTGAAHRRARRRTG